MSETDSPPVADTVAYHSLLLRLAGRVPDELVSESRQWLAEGRLVELAQSVVYVAVANRIPLTDAGAELLYRTLTAAGEDTGALLQLERADLDELPPFEFAPAGAPVLAEFGETIPPSLDLTGNYTGPAGPDLIDTAAIAAIAAEPGVVGLWRAWRYPLGDSPWPPPKRVFVATVDAADGPAGLPALTARLQAALVAAGEADPQVEVADETEVLPAYQRLLRASSALLWAATPPVRIHVARVFDGADAETGPRFDPDHALLGDADEREQVLDYLAAGVALLYTTAMMDDVVDRSRTEVVPLSFRTDGVWIWTDSVGYYLDQHQLEPDPELLEHIRTNAYQVPPIDSVAIHRAMVKLQTPVEEEAVWSFGESDPELDGDPSGLADGGG